ncbi:TPA: O-antigen ligase family protein [Streptococcus suis]
MKVRLRINNAAIIYTLFAIAFMGGRILKIQSLVANFGIALVGLCALSYSILKKGKRGINAYLILIGVLYSVFMILSLFYNGNADYLDLLWIWAYMGIAILTYEFEISKRTYWNVAYFIIALICIYMVKGGDAASLLSIGSQNNISAYVIFFVIMGYLSIMNEKRVIKYYAGFLTLAICLWTGSRGGVISASLLLVGTFLYNFLAIKGQKIKSLAKWCVLICFAVWAVTHFFGKYLLGFIDKLDRYGTSSNRTEIWKEYIQGIKENIGNFFFGANTSNGTYRWLSIHDGNTHNSFLMLHAKFGLLALGLLIFLIFLVVHKAIKEKNYIMIIILFAASARMFTDWIAFPGLYDVLFWYMCLYILNRQDYEDRRLEQLNE